LLHSVLSSIGYDVKMLFLKVNGKKTRDEYKERSKKLFKNEIDHVTDKEIEIMERYVLGYKPHMVAVSLVSSNFELYKKIYERMRTWGNFKTVLGGWQPSLSPERCIDHCDILCVGEGEEVLPELAEALSEGKRIDGIKNLWIRKNGKIIKNDPRPLVSDLNALPNFIFDNNLAAYIEDDRIAYEDPYMSNTRYGVIAGRGCPYRCTYCSNSYMSRIYPKWSSVRHRSVDRVMEELVEVKKRLPKVERINFYDEVFMPSKEWIRKFSERYKQEIGLPFYCMFYPGRCDDETAKLLKERVSLDGVWLGVQSGSERVRREVFKRYHTNEDVLKQAGIFHKHGINVRYDFILDNPFETFAESLESINIMLKFPQPFSLNLFSMKFFPKTEITSMALAEGLINEEELDDRRSNDRHNYMVSMSDDNSDSNFVNYLATYISFLAFESKLKKNEITEIINDYAVHRKIEPIKDKVRPFLRA